MPTMELLMGLVGQPVGADAVRAVIASDSLVLSSDPFLVERHYLSGPEVGYELMHIDWRIDTAFIFPVATKGYRPFRGPLVAGLSSRSTRSDVRQRLGRPSRSGEGRTVSRPGRLGTWDRYDWERVCIHFQYTESGERIRQVTVMAADSAP